MPFPMIRNNTLSGAACVALSAVLFGFMPLMANVSYSDGSNPCMIALGRFFFGALLTAIVIVQKRLPFALTWPQFRKLFLMSVFYSTMPLMLYASYRYIDSGLATTLHFSYPVLVMLLMATVFGKRFGSRQTGSLLLCMGGLLLLYRMDGETSLWGMAIAVCSGALYAVYIVLLSTSGLRSISVFVLTFWLSLLASIELAFMAALSGNLLLFHSPSTWLAELCMGLFTTTMALALFQKGVFLCGEVRASLLSTLEPVTGVLVGMAVLHENITFHMVCGIILILLSGLILIEKKSPASPVLKQNTKNTH